MPDETNTINTTNTTETSFKYTSHEEAEKGYKNLEGLLGQKEAEKRSAVEEIEAKFKAPESYHMAEDAGMDEAMQKELNQVAESAALTQSQYDKLVEQYKTRNRMLAEKDKVDEAARANELSSISDYTDKKSKLQAYIDQNYNEKMAGIAKQQLKDKAFFESMWTERERKVNSSTLANTTAPVEKPITIDDLQLIRKQMRQQPHRLDLKDKYIEMISKRAKSKA